MSPKLDTGDVAFYRGSLRGIIRVNQKTYTHVQVVNGSGGLGYTIIGPPKRSYIGAMDKNHCFYETDKRWPPKPKGARR